MGTEYYFQNKSLHLWVSRFEYVPTKIAFRERISWK